VTSGFAHAAGEDTRFGCTQKHPHHSLAKWQAQGTPSNCKLGVANAPFGPAPRDLDGIVDKNPD
jgi:hypothetical protein